MLKNKREILSEYRKNELSELAEDIAEFYCPDNLINPELIAKKKNITYSYGEYGNFFDGLIQCLDREFHIYINLERLKNPYAERSRYTFAHELGHFFIDEHRNSLISGKVPSHSSFTNFASENIVELEADYFAACLLMPRLRFQKDLLTRCFSFSLLSELQKKYQASLTATAIRFTEIGNHPIMIIYGVGGNIKWRWYSKDFRYKWLLGGGEKVPENSVMGEYFFIDRISKFTEEVWFEDWFEYVTKNDLGKSLYEHCIVSENKAISILWEK